MECIVCNGEFYEDHRIAWFRLSDPTQWIVYFAMYSSLGSYIFSSTVSNPQLFPSGRKGETVQRLRDPKQLGEALGTAGAQWGFPIHLQLSSCRTPGLYSRLLHESLTGNWMGMWVFLSCECSPQRVNFSSLSQRKGSSHLPIPLSGSLLQSSNWKYLQVHTMPRWQPTSPLYATELLN